MSRMRTLIGGVGYSYLRDGSFGPLVVTDLAKEPWPDGVLVEDLSYGPIAVMQRLQEADPPFDRLVLVAAVRRGRVPGAVTLYRWDRRLPDAEEIQARVAEAVTGVISLDNVLVVVGFFGALPPDVSVVDGLSATVESARGRVMDMVRERAVGGSASQRDMRTARA
jgi:hydrogenase maturation protease